MRQDYRTLVDDEIEALEKLTLRTLVQALQEYSKEAKSLFETTSAERESEVIVLAEDLVQYALEVAEVYPINKRFAGFIDYKRVRWLPAPFGLFPQVLLVDAKASTEGNRETLQQSQLPMDADFESNGAAVTLAAGVPPHMEIDAHGGVRLPAVTTSVFVHFYYSRGDGAPNRCRDLRAIFVLAVPHQRLKARYNPTASISFFGQGKHSPARSEEPRIRVYFNRLKKMCRWRLQELWFKPGADYATPIWHDRDAGGVDVEMPFAFIGR